MGLEAISTSLKSKYIFMIHFFTISNINSLYSYGFTLDETNLFTALEFRVILGHNPKEQIKNAASLLPDEKILQDEENLELATEMVKVKANRVSEGFLSYLRSALMMKNFESEDKKYLNVSSPVLIDFELIVVDFAVELLTQWANLPKNKHYYMNSSLAEDNKRLKELREAALDRNAIVVLEYNIQLKRTL